MRRLIALSLLLLWTVPAFSQDYGTKVSFTYAPIAPDYLGVETMDSLHDPSFGSQIVDSPVWSPDGKFIAFSNVEYIFLVPAEGGKAEMKYASVYLFPYKDSNLILYETINKIVGFSSDGRTLYFMHNLLDEESGVTINVTENSNGGLSINITQGEVIMVLAGLDIETGEVQTVARNISNAAMSRSGKYLMIYDRAKTLINVKNLEEGGEWDVAAPTGFDGMLTVSANEKYLVYSKAEGNGSYQIFRMPLHGGAAEQLSTNPGGDTGLLRFNPVCCPGDDWILYDDYGTEKYSNDITTPEGHISYDKIIIKMCAFNTGTGETLDLFPASTYINTRRGQLSPDGKRLCYVRENYESASERYGIYIKDVSSFASDPDGQVSVADDAPKGFALTGNHPNPFNPSTTISFTLPSSGAARLSIYDVTGRKVRDLVSPVLSAGAHEMVWDGRDDSGKSVSSGTYLARLKMGGFTASHRMTLVK